MMDIAQLIGVVGAVVAMIYGLYIINQRIKAKNQGFGPNALKIVGVVLFIPTILILALVTNFQSETLAALLGTVAGYVLSNNNKNDDSD